VFRSPLTLSHNTFQFYLRFLRLPPVIDFRSLVGFQCLGAYLLGTFFVPSLASCSFGRSIFNAVALVRCHVFLLPLLSPPTCFLPFSNLDWRLDRSWSPPSFVGLPCLMLTLCHAFSFFLRQADPLLCAPAHPPPHHFQLSFCSGQILLFFYFLLFSAVSTLSSHFFFPLTSLSHSFARLFSSSVLILAVASFFALQKRSRQGWCCWAFL